MNKILQNFWKKISDFVPFVIPVVFFLVSLFTIYDYGMNWDSPIHFARGQAYLRYIFTGKTDYKGIETFCRGKDNFNSRVDYKTGEICDRHRKIRVSEYQSNYITFDWAKKNDIGGHPPLSDIFMAITNQVFFIKLGLIEDVSSYHVFPIFTTFLLALVVSLWVKQTYGIFASFIAVLIVYLFPLLFGEQHFNVKDPPMAAFFTIAIYLFWLSLSKKKPLYMILSAIFAGFSFSTKFNFIFAPFIILSWLIFYVGIQFFSKILKRKRLGFGELLISYIKNIHKGLLGAIVLYPFIIFTIFFASWPVLWSDPIKNIGIVFGFYKGIGSVQCPYDPFSPIWFIHCSSTITVTNFLYTLPLITLFFFAIGVIVSVAKYREKSNVTILWLSFFFVTILRVTLPVNAIYGGLRQIMEFIAPTAMIASLGALFLRNVIVALLLRVELFNRMRVATLTFLVSCIFLLGFIPTIITIIKIHPNENLYFNSLIGGLKGAAQRNFPGFASTYGNAYMQAVNWLNRNADKNPRLALLWGLGSNISRVSLREDISFANYYHSGYNQEGEYGIMTLDQNPYYNRFSYKFVDTFLNPVYVLNVEGVPILKIWKNDPKFVKNGIDIKSEEKEQVEVEKKEDGIVISLKDPKRLKRIELSVSDKSCKEYLNLRPIGISLDKNNYTVMPETFNDLDEYEVKNYPANRVFLFEGEKAQYIKIALTKESPCNNSRLDFAVYTFLNLFKKEK